MAIQDHTGSIRPSSLHGEALHRKYREERDKRLRTDGNDQYLQLRGRFAHYAIDPYTPVTPRGPRTDHVTFAFIGGGFAGLVTGARLVEAGVRDVRIVEKGGGFGGTWYWNRYPGAMCDTASMVYMPLLEETGHMPSEKYAHGPEILEQCERIGRQFGLYDNALFHTEVTDLSWDDTSKVWTIRTDRGDAFTAQFVGLGTGPLHVPKLPGIPGIESFKGHAFHTSRWDYEYTGGDRFGAPMTKLKDKRVAVIGTGATAVQCVPPLARDCGGLWVFQRTPSSVDVRANAPIDRKWFEGIATPGWQERWLENFTANQAGGTASEDLVQDGWTDLARRIRARVMKLPRDQMTVSNMLAAFEDSDDEKMTEIRARVDSIVKDPDTASKLKAWYRQLCKRPCFHDEYLQAFNQPNVHLVDTDGKGVERITERGVVVDGIEVAVDCIIFASGFEAFTRRHRAWWRQTLAIFGGWHAQQARHARARLSQRVHRWVHAGREPPLERAAQPDRVRQDDRGDRPACVGRAGTRSGGDEGGRRCLDRASAERPRHADRIAGLHTWLLQQRGSGRRHARQAQCRLSVGCAGVLPLLGRVAAVRTVRGSGVQGGVSFGEVARRAAHLVRGPPAMASGELTGIHISGSFVAVTSARSASPMGRDMPDC
jgi:cation diffusion facilitator CzcD-associated flavoprotein CzcO